MYTRGRSRLLKGGTTRPIIIVDVELVSIIFTLIVCEAHRHAKHANTSGVWGYAPPGNFEKLHLLRLIKSEGIFSSLSTFDVPVGTGTENFLKMYYLHAYIHAGQHCRNYCILK